MRNRYPHEANEADDYVSEHGTTKFAPTYGPPVPFRYRMTDRDRENELVVAKAVAQIERAFGRKL